MKRVRRRIKDRKVLRLILAFLKADIMVEGTLRHPVTGTPQGGIISPLLANVYLFDCDRREIRALVPAPARGVRQGGRSPESRPESGASDLLRGAIRGRFCRPRGGDIGASRGGTQRAGGISPTEAPHGAVD